MPAPAVTCVVFRIGELTCALPVEHAVEVLRMRRLITVDDIPPGVLGVALVRGVHVPVVDPAFLMGVPASPARLLVIRSGDRTAALAVDEVTGVRAIPRSDFDARPQLLTGDDRPLVTSLATRDRATWLVLDASRILHEAHASG